MLETVCTRRKVIRIAGDDYPAELVKSKFMKLNSNHIQFVIDCMHQNTTKIRNIKKYLLAVLFNAPNTIDSYYTALVAHDMASGVFSSQEREDDFMSDYDNAIFRLATAQEAEQEDYTGGDGLLYYGNCRQPKEACFPEGKTFFGRDRHPKECDCQRKRRERSLGICELTLILLDLRYFCWTQNPHHTQHFYSEF